MLYVGIHKTILANLQGTDVYLAWHATVSRVVMTVAKTFAPTGVGKARDIGFLRSSLHAFLIRQKAT